MVPVIHQVPSVACRTLERQNIPTLSCEEMIRSRSPLEELWSADRPAHQPNGYQHGCTSRAPETNSIEITACCCTTLSGGLPFWPRVVVAVLGAPWLIRVVFGSSDLSI